MATFGPKDYNTLVKELCGHLTTVATEAGQGDQKARQWLLGGFGGHKLFLEEFWQQADAGDNAKFMSNADRLQRRRDLLADQAQATLQLLGRMQAELRDIDQTLQDLRRAPLAAEIIARRQEWETQQADAQRKAEKERFAEQQRKERERAQNADDYAARVAQQHQERAQREAENAERRRRELAPFMP